MATYTAASRSLRSAVPRPITPSRAYLAGLSKGSSQAEDTSLKLVVLDLNGTLLFRHRGERGERLHEQPIQRPGLRAFCEYLFSHFAVMVWSSATPTNVQSMCARIFSHKQRDQLVNVWARDTLGLSEREYHTKCQTSKNLERVWQDTRVRQLKRFSQRDTILIDDSKLKALAQPYNLIEVPEFTLERAEKGTDDVLREVQAYLERLRTATNVSAVCLEWYESR